MNSDDELDKILDLAGFQIFPSEANEDRIKAKALLTRLIESREREARIDEWRQVLGGDISALYPIDTFNAFVSVASGYINKRLAQLTQVKEETHLDRGLGFTHSAESPCVCLEPNAKEDVL